MYITYIYKHLIKVALLANNKSILQTQCSGGALVMHFEALIPVWCISDTGVISAVISPAVLKGQRRMGGS